MATPESIETIDPNSAGNLAEIPRACDFKSARPMTVSYGQRGALLRLHGDCFLKSGFPIGTPVTVYVAQGLLIVQAMSTQLSKAAKVKAAREPTPPLPAAFCSLPSASLLSHKVRPSSAA